MTKKTFKELVAFVRRTNDVEVHTSRKMKRIGPDFPWAINGFAVPDVRDFIENALLRNDGPYQYRRQARHGISMTVHPSTSYDVRASILIHEFGHCQIFRKTAKEVRKKYSPYREEVRAWDLGMRSVPVDLLPKQKTYQKVAIGALCTYFGLSKKEIVGNL